MKPMLLLVGLGNPGASYARTRHNAGFQAVERLAAEFGTGEWEDRQKFQSRCMEGRIVTAPVLLVQPLTYMNRSGEAIRKIVDFYKMNPAEQVIVFCDDIDLPLGAARFRRSGGPGTHNGLKSIVEQFGEAFPRIRIGMGGKPAGADLAGWVLSVPPADDAAAIAAAIDGLPETVRQFLLEGRKDD